MTLGLAACRLALSNDNPNAQRHFESLDLGLFFFIRQFMGKLVLGAKWNTPSYSWPTDASGSSTLIRLEMFLVTTLRKFSLLMEFAHWRARSGSLCTSP